jgi:hypothetical protein
LARSRPDKSAQAVESLLSEGQRAQASKDLFAAQAAAAEALRLSHQARDYARMAEAVGQLNVARQDIRRAAAKARRVTIIEGEIPSGAELKPGCYIVQPPRVGIDGRTLREIAAAARIPALVVVREPTTRSGLWPVVALGPVTVRTRIKPPAPTSSKPAKAEPKPTPAWVQGALDALATASLADVPGSPATVRVEALVERLGTVPESAELHEQLQRACLAAADELAAAAGKPLSKG